MNKKKLSQNEIADKFLENSDLAQREQEVLKDASKKLDFVPERLLSRSAWWGSTKIGAFHYLGKFNGQSAILKIQGVKPETSEIYMIEQFSKQNKSKIIRPPHLYATLPWDNKRRYEALVMETVSGDRIIHLPTTADEVEKFFRLYDEYRNNCRNKPWLAKPALTISERLKKSFTKWRNASHQRYLHHPYRKMDDEELIGRAVEILCREYKCVAYEFVHGHLSAEDFYQAGSQVVVLSNLYWSWRPPFYDTIFAYCWFRYHLADLEKITPEEVDQQKSLWLNQIFQIAKFRGGNSLRLLKLALLERDCAGLNLDALSILPSKPIAKYLVDTTREEIKELLKNLN